MTLSKLNTLFLMFVCAIVFSGCQPAQNNDFAIYLLVQDIPTAELANTDINDLTLESEPLIGSDDVIVYHKSDHVLELTRSAYTRVQQIFPMPVRVNGIPFVVCVGEQRVYTGAFWTPVSSLSYDGVVIMQPWETNETTIQVDLGYPVPEVFTGNDPRADPRIMQVLEEGGKLK